MEVLLYCYLSVPSIQRKLILILMAALIYIQRIIDRISQYSLTFGLDGKRSSGGTFTKPRPHKFMTEWHYTPAV